MTDIIDRETLENDFRHYRSIPFWSWNNKLEPEELKRQIREMKEVGLGGFIMHARTGLITEYLSEEWFECVRVCLDEARALGMDAWIYDENGWPSGFVGGRLLEDPANLAQYLTCETKPGFDASALCVYLREGRSFRRVRGDEGAGEYRCVYLHASPANTDILDPAVVTQFIELTYEEYAKRFGDRFGKEFVGFFTDEPQYYRYDTPFTHVAAEAYAREYGEDLYDGLIWLFSTEPEAYPFRTRYYRLLNQLYTENFYRRIYEWCDAHGAKFTGHSVEENRLYTQMWGGAGAMPSYEYEHVPGIDFLGRMQETPLASKQVGSAASQLGKSQVLTETFGCSGWDAEPRELKFLAECQFVNGVNYMCLHLMSYSLQGQGKLDHPPCFSRHMTWWGEDYKQFNDYFGHLGYLLAATRELVDTVVLHPMHSVYLRYKRLDESEVMALDASLTQLMSELVSHGVRYHFADERLLREHGRAEGGVLSLGLCSYRNVVLPKCLTVDASTKVLLEDYAAQGGRVFVYDGLPEYVDGEPGTLNVTSNIGWKELSEGGPIRLSVTGSVMSTYREGKGFRLLYLLNGSGEEARVRLPEGNFTLLDPVALTESPAPAELVLAHTDAAVLIEREGKGAPRAPRAETVSCLDAADAFRLRSAAPNNLTLDYVSISRDGGEFEPPRYVYAVKDVLIREDFKGRLRAKYCFRVDDVCPLTLRYEKAKWLSVRCNGKEVRAETSDFDFNFLDADLTGCVHPGENELMFEIDYFQSPVVRYALYDPEATESLRNCLVYDTEVESVYLRGDFSLTEDLHIAAPRRGCTLSRIDGQGFPMFSGEMVFEGEVDFASETAEVTASGRYMTAAVEIDGRPAGSFVLSDRLTVHAEPGRRRVTLRLRSSLRNTFGPFHLTDPEPLGVGPQSFTLLGMWTNGACEAFYPGYHTVPFGIDRLTFRFLK